MNIINIENMSVAGLDQFYGWARAAARDWADDPRAPRTEETARFIAQIELNPDRWDVDSETINAFVEVILDEWGL